MKRIYSRYIKRILDIVLSLMALVALSPLLILLVALGALAMRGNPFFVQERVGKDEKIFKLFKFRTMSNKRNSEGSLLSDTARLNKYGRFLRAMSLDELPSLLNIVIGNMSIVGPRPLVVKYLPYYTEKERHRHDVRPGLTGLAQINGRNSLSWEEKFAYDLEYIGNVTFYQDVKIIFLTVKKVLDRADIGQGEKAPISLHILRQDKVQQEEKAAK